MNTLTQGFIKGLEGFITSKNDLDRLKHMPQQVKDGRLVNFKGHNLTGKIEGLEDFIIMDADKVMDAKRFTGALLGTYLEGFNKLQGEEDEDSNEEPTLEDDLLDAVEVGDKKVVRAILKELKDQWFALDGDIVEDAIDDIKDCVATKNVKEVESILDSLEPSDAPTKEYKVQVKKETKITTPSYDAKGDVELDNEGNEETVTYTQEDDEEDLVLDIVDALKDEDIEDVEMLLKELGEDHSRYNGFNKSLATLKGDGKSNPVVETDETENEEDEIDDIIDDLEDAIMAKEFEGKDGAKEILAELLEVVGEDHPRYKEFNKIVNPPVEERQSRRSRRGK